MSTSSSFGSPARVHAPRVGTLERLAIQYEVTVPPMAALVTPDGEATSAAPRLDSLCRGDDLEAAESPAAPGEGYGGGGEGCGGGVGAAPPTSQAAGAAGPGPGLRVVSEALRCVVFDFDSTLSTPQYLERFGCWAIADKAIVCAEMTEAEIWANLGGRDRVALLKRTLATLRADGVALYVASLGFGAAIVRRGVRGIRSMEATFSVAERQHARKEPPGPETKRAARAERSRSDRRPLTTARPSARASLRPGRTGPSARVSTGTRAPSPTLDRVPRSATSASWVSAPTSSLRTASAAGQGED